MTGLLERYRVERDGLLGRLVALLEGDSRVAAAWLFGSLGRGDSDALSDIDLFLVVDDAQVTETVAERRTYVARAGGPVLVHEVPQNAPEGGAYLAVLYDAPLAPHHVDWYWRPAAGAAVPTDARLLFDRVGLPRGHGPTVFPSRPPVERLLAQPSHQARFFWMMLMIAAKHLVRAPATAGIPLLDYVLGPYRATQQLLGQPGDVVEVPVEDSVVDRLRYLRGLATGMEAQLAALAAQGDDPPSAVVPAAHRYLRMLEDAWVAGELASLE